MDKVGQLTWKTLCREFWVQIWRDRGGICGHGCPILADYLTLSRPGEGGIRPPPLRFLLLNSKTPGDIEKYLSDFNFTPLTDILRILSITIVIRCCHSNLLFPVCTSFFGLKNKET